jgi:uncharacterized protein affecting Mg2+/Co2+ transport
MIMDLFVFAYTVTIRNGQSRETDIDIHKKKTLEM